MLPVIDDVDEENFEYVATGDDHVRGGMDRKLMHRWIAPRNVAEDQGCYDSISFMMRDCFLFIQ